MKNVFLRLSLFLCGICVGQPMPPTLACVDYEVVKFNKSEPKDKIELPNKFIRIDVNYGFETTLDFHLLRGNKNTLFGIGYSTYIGNDVKDKPIGVGFNYNFLNSYKVRDRAYYFLLGRQIKRLSICGKLGIYTNANYNNYTNDIPNSIYYAKVSTEADFQYGGQVSWLANKTTGLSVGWDKFNGFTIGITTSL
jgi:hypothetical protein